MVAYSQECSSAIHNCMHPVCCVTHAKYRQCGFADQVLSFFTFFISRLITSHPTQKKQRCSSLFCYQSCSLESFISHYLLGFEFCPQHVLEPSLNYITLFIFCWKRRYVRLYINYIHNQRYCFVHISHVQQIGIPIECLFKFEDVVRLVQAT